MKNQDLLSKTVLWTALITPLLSNGQVDFASLSALVNEQQQAGNGILLLGSTGEGLALDEADQKAIVQHVCQLRPTTGLMVAVGGFNLEAQLKWLTFCNSLPIDAFLLGSPLYAKPAAAGQQQWFSALLDASDHPCMLYNVPSRSGVEIAPQVLTQLQDHPRCWALKEASGSIAKFEAFRRAAPNMAIFSGDDALTPYFARAGAAGLVSVAANVWPAQTHEFVKQSLAGTRANLFEPWSEAVQALFSAPNPIPTKCLLHHLGRIASPCLRAPLTHLEVSDLAPLESAHQKIHAWQ